MIKYRGVFYDRKRKLYRAALEVKGKSVFLGRYKTAKQAAKIYDEAAKNIFGLKAKLNFAPWSRATKFQLKCYKLCSSDFAGLTQRQAANVLNVKQPVVCVALRRLKVKCPVLFPIYQPKGRTQRFEDWMSNEVKE